MNLDLISTTYGQTTFNVKLAHILGLKTALYWSVITDALYQAKKKNKVSETGYFVIDRKFVYEVSTLTTPEQKECEKILNTLGYLVNGTKVNSISIDVASVVKLITEDDPKQIEFIRKEIEKITSVDKEAQSTEARAKNLKAHIKETDFDVRDSLYGWVDSLEGRCNVKTVEIFENTLNSYTKDKKVKLELIKKATLNGYRDLEWVIKSYEQSSGIKPSPSKQVGAPTNVATSTAEVNLTQKF